VIVDVPVPEVRTAVTLPEASTVATDGLLLDHVTAFGAFVGKTETLSPKSRVPLNVRLKLPPLIVTEVTTTATACTLTLAVAEKLPSAVLAVIVTCGPSLSPETTPLATDATLGSLDVQVTVLLVALSGAT
jgi:hypothetical protein